MTTPTTRPTRDLLLDRDIERLRKQLIRFDPYLARTPSVSDLAEFDMATERLIGAVFGETAELVRMYEYAQLGEAESLVNLPEEAQEHGAQDVGRESVRQRRRVLESCIWELEARRATAAKGPHLPPKLAPKVLDYMSENVRSIHRDGTLKEAGQLMEKHKIGLLFVDDASRYIGIITDTLITRHAVAEGLDPKTTPVKTCMSKRIVSIEDNQPIVEAVKLMKEHGIRHLAVSKNNTIIGLLSVSDLVRYYSGIT